MSLSADWSASAAVQRCERYAWQSEAWRIHRQRYRADDPGGSLRVSGRYHRGGDLYPVSQVYAALYLALSPETALAELVRHIIPDLLLALNSYRLTRLEVQLADVVDLRDADLLGIGIDELCSDTDHDLTRALGSAAYSSGAEAITIPSATRLGDNLIIFPDKLRETSRIRVIGHREPRLYVEHAHSGQ